MNQMKSTPRSTDNIEDIVYRLEYASMSTPEMALLRDAALEIRKLRERLGEDPYGSHR